MKLSFSTTINKSILAKTFAALFATALIYGYFVEPNSIKIKNVVINNENLRQILEGYKVVQLSDLQVSRIGYKERKIASVMIELEPDIVFITGDFIAYGASFEPVLKLLESIPAKIGIWAVLGNSDYSNEAGSCIMCHEKNSRFLRSDGSIRFLRNSADNIEIPSTSNADDIGQERRLTIIGLDDPVTGRADLDQSLESALAGSPKILLSHSPDVFQDAVKKDVDLLLAGHTHGGQLFFVPFLKKFIGDLDGHNLRFVKGIYRDHNTTMYVNAGLGTSVIPFRIGVRPEITVFEFK